MMRVIIVLDELQKTEITWISSCQKATWIQVVSDFWSSPILSGNILILTKIYCEDRFHSQPVFQKNMPRYQSNQVDTGRRFTKWRHFRDGCRDCYGVTGLTFRRKNRHGQELRVCVTVISASVTVLFTVTVVNQRKILFRKNPYFCKKKSSTYF